MREKEFYSAGIYLRLSRDDITSGKSVNMGNKNMKGRNGKKESNSITSQREFCRSFVRNQSNMEIFDIYVDDGYSGANFDRPDFQRMMEDVKLQKINCIIVKDLSRFGRDYIEAGRLIQKTFPALNVRFIAITDHFDSLTADFNETSLMLPVRNFVNDSYCRDISCKVRSHQKIKREKGEFIGAFTVYGYCKDERDRNKLVPDKYASQIVRSIFAWRMDGMSTVAIAEKLNGMGVLSPMEYKKSKGENYNTGFTVRLKTEWSPVAVKRILTNEIYTGTMVQGRSEKISYKLNKSREKPREEWIRAEGTHEPVVTREDFDNVQRLMTSSSRAFKGQKKSHMFSGFLFCGDCMEPMIRRANRYNGAERISFICPTRNKGQGCTRHSISEKELKDIILKALKVQAEFLADEEKILSCVKRSEVNFEELTRFNQEIVRLRQEEEKYLSLRSSLYEDLKGGIITQEDFYAFRNIYEEQYVRTQEAIKKQEEMLPSLFKSGVASGIRLEQFGKELELKELSRDVLLSFIDRILVYEDKRICMEFKNREKFGRILLMTEYANGRREV